MIKALRRVTYDVPALNAIQEEVERVLRPVLACPLLDGRLIEDIPITTAGYVVEHKLGRAWRGYVVVKASAQVDVWHIASADESKHLSLDASGSATISVWVF